MVNHHISADLKDCVLKLWEARWHWSDICYALSVSPASFYQWRLIFEEFGTTTKPASPLIGWPHFIMLAILTAVKELYKNHPNTYIDKLQWFLVVHHDIPISIPALHDNLEKAGLSCKILHKIACECDVQTRNNFLHAICTKFSGTGTEFVVINESCKNEHNVTWCYGWAPIGQAPEFVNPFVHGEHYSLVAAMSTIGYITTQVQPGSFNSFGFFDFIVKEVVCISALFYLAKHED